MFDEVVDLDDAGMVRHGEELAFGDGNLLRLLSAGLKEAFEHYPAIADVAVDRQIDPADAAVCDAALNGVLAGDHLTGFQLRREREHRAAIRTHAFAWPRSARGTPLDRSLACAAVPFRLGDNGIGECRARRFDVLANRNFDQAVADEPPSGAQPRAGGLDLDQPRFAHQDGARALVSSHVNPDTSVLVDWAPGRAR